MAKRIAKNLYLDCGRYYIVTRIEKGQHPKWIPLPDDISESMARKEVQRFKLKRELNQKNGLVSTNLTFGEVAGEYLDLRNPDRQKSYDRENIRPRKFIPNPKVLKNYRSFANNYRVPTKFFGNRSLNKIFSNDIENYICQRGGEISQAMLLKELYAISKVFQREIRKVTEKAMQTGRPVTLFNPVDLVRKTEFWPSVNNTRKRKVSDREFRLIFKNAVPHVKLFMAVAEYTGSRKGEILNIKKGDIDLFSNVIRFPDTKNGEDILKEIHPTLKNILLNAMENDKSGCEYLVNFEGCRVKDIKKAFDKAVQRAGLDNIIPHDLRKRTAMRISRIPGMSPGDVMDFMGWKSLAMYSRYNLGGNSCKAAGKQPEPITPISYEEWRNAA
ncbi:MAG: site-specific integrase [bacterium]